MTINDSTTTTKPNIETKEEAPHVEKKETTGPHISIKAEEVLSYQKFPVTNSLLLSSLTFILFIFLVAKYNLDAKSKTKSTFFYFINFCMRGLYDFLESAMKEKTAKYFSLLGAFFFFILLQNWSGLLPGVGSVLLNHTPLLRANTADLNTTLALGLVSVISIQVFGVRAVGLKNYLGKFFNFSSPMSLVVGILEIISEFSRILSFAFRLFGNIFAGEVLLAVVAFLVPVLVSFPFLLLETFVGIIQAVVFAMLSAVLINLATTKAHH